MSRSAVFAPRLKVSILILLTIGVFLIVFSQVSGISPLAQLFAATQRIIAIAVSDRTEMQWFVLVCIGAGLLVIADRRRRARVRQAAS